jgi:hypothetical protein
LADAEAIKKQEMERKDKLEGLIISFSANIVISEEKKTELDKSKPGEKTG